MSDDHISLWHSAADAFHQRHRHVVDADLRRPTPCDEFDVEALIRHAVDTQINIGSLLGASTEPGAAWEPTRLAMAATLEGDGALEGDAQHPNLGTIAKSRLIEIATHDLVVHTWDLSRAIGVVDELPVMNLRPALDSILAFPEQVREAVFAAPVEVGDSATLQSQLLAIAGRQP